MSRRHGAGRPPDTARISGTMPAASSGHPLRRDHLVDYVEQGKRSYRIASRFVSPEIRQEAEVLRELAELFGVCMYGLHLVRQQWERLGRDSYEAATGALLG